MDISFVHSIAWSVFGIFSAFTILGMAGLIGMFSRLRTNVLYAIPPIYRIYKLAKIVERPAFGVIHMVLSIIYFVISSIFMFAPIKIETISLPVLKIILIILCIILIVDLFAKSVIYTAVCIRWEQPKEEFIKFLIIPDIMFYIYGFGKGHTLKYDSNEFTSSVKLNRQMRRQLKKNRKKNSEL